MGINFQAAAVIWSFRRELFFVFLCFLLVLLIPIIAVITLTNVGLPIISDRLATYNPQTNKVEIRDPRTGKAVEDLTITAVWPVHGVVTLEFGQSDFPYQIFHTGIDIASPKHQIGDSVTTFMEGTVIFAGESPIGLGKHVIVDNGNNITSFYGHLSAIYVSKGDKVKPGDIIGAEGQTGWATGPHVHFQTDVYGIPVNPRTFLQGDP